VGYGKTDALSQNRNVGVTREANNKNKNKLEDGLELGKKLHFQSK